VKLLHDEVGGDHAFLLVCRHWPTMHIKHTTQETWGTLLNTPSQYSLGRFLTQMLSTIQQLSPLFKRADDFSRPFWP